MNRYILFAFLFTLAGGFLGAEDSRADNSAPDFPYKHLSNEDIEPFLWYGRAPKIEEGKGVQNAYVHAAQELRDVRQCLIESEQKKSKPDLRLIDWRRLGHGPELGVCLFRIFSSLGNIDHAVEWMKYHRIEPNISENYEYHSHIDSDLNDNEKEYLKRLYGEYDSRQYGPLVPSSIWIRWTFGLLWPASSEYISSYWTKDMRLKHVEYGASRI